MLQLLVLVVQIIVIIGGTIAVYTFDRNRRRANGGLSMHDPDTRTLALFAVFLNVVCLPYYFRQTRGGVAGLAIGVGWFLPLMLVATIAGIIGAIVG